MITDGGKDRRGFSLVELLVVTVLGALILIATYNVLITNQRTYTVNTANLQGQQTVRAGMDVLFTELREISPAGGDLLRMDGDSLTIKVMRSAGILCDSTTPGQSDQYRWDVITLGDTLVITDSVWLFDENQQNTADDDVWFQSNLVAFHAPPLVPACTGHTVQRVRFNWDADTSPNQPTIGTLVRTYTTYTYGLGLYGGIPYLIRKKEPSGTAEPLVGPLRSGSGVSFEYLDANGDVTAVAAAVVQIVVTLRTQHQARDAQGNLVADSLTTRIYTRN